MHTIFFISATALLPLAFTSFAIYAALRASNFSLPTPSLTHILAIVLPFLNYLTLYPTQTTDPSTRLLPIKPSRRSRLQTLLPPRQVTLTALFILDAILLTLASTALSSPAFSCVLERHWRDLFMTKNEDAIRGIQDKLECCGFRVVKDQAWPFPAKGVTAGTCAERYGRTRSCEGPWSAEENAVLGMVVGVGVGVVVLKILFLLLERFRPGWFQRGGERDKYAPLAAGRVVDEEEDGGGAERGRFLDEPEGGADGSGHGVNGQQQQEGRLLQGV
ncbi:hypothetical protein MMC13_003603 [Lambiella insularis]|nr:hypothetical protein [Lambiella insularis]